MAYSNPLLRDDNPLGKIVAMLVCICLVPLAFLLENHEDRCRAAAQKAFLQGEFELIVVYEDDPNARMALEEACQEKILSPLAFFEEEEGLRCLYQPKEKLQLPNLPRLRYVQKTSAGAAFIYEIFQGEKACEQFKKWAKENDYPQWDFSLNCENPESYATSSVAFKNEWSEVNVVCFFTSEQGRLHLWQGDKIADVSEGITGQKNSAKTEKYYREYTTWLKDVRRGRPRED